MTISLALGILAATVVVLLFASAVGVIVGMLLPLDDDDFEGGA